MNLIDSNQPFDPLSHYDAGSSLHEVHHESRLHEPDGAQHFLRRHGFFRARVRESDFSHRNQNPRALQIRGNHGSHGEKT